MPSLPSMHTTHDESSNNLSSLYHPATQFNSISGNIANNTTSPVSTCGFTQSPPRPAPSSDILAMLAQGVSLNSPVNSATSETSGFETHHAGNSIPRDRHNATFKMSDFPALDGRASISLNSMPREAQSPLGPTESFSGIREDAMYHSNSEYAVESDLSKGNLTSHAHQNAAVFAMQSEDFPALPGSQMHQSVLFSDSDVAGANTMLGAAIPETLDSAVSSTLKRNHNVLGMQLPLIGQTASRQSRGHLANCNNVDIVQAAQSSPSSSMTQSRIFAESMAHSTHLHDDPIPINRSNLLNMRINAVTASGNHSACSSDSGNLPDNGDLENQAKFGLLGLLDVIRMTNPDLNTLALGSDLTTLGLNLNSAECLYSTFASPWAEAPTTREPQFSLPMCYYMQPPPLKTSHLSKFQLETLFYIFYAMPKDVLQAYSAQELYNREWQYHQDMKLWFKRGSSGDGLSTMSHQYIYFDINTWECRLFSNSHLENNITACLLPEDEVRVKFAT